MDCDIILSVPSNIGSKRKAPIAQLDRAFDYESKGHRFESCWVHHEKPLTSFAPLRVFLLCFEKLRRKPFHRNIQYEKKFSKPAESSASRRVSCRFRSLFLYSRFVRFHPLCLLIQSERSRLNFTPPHAILRHIRLHFSLSSGNLYEHSSLCPLSCGFLYFLSRCASVSCPCTQSYEVP